MKKLTTVFILLLFARYGFAGHIAGGEMYYKYIGPGTSPNSSQYQVTLRLFRECHPVGTAAPLPGDVYIGIFRNTGPATLMTTVDVQQSSNTFISLKQVLSCIINPPEICYQVATYSFTQELADDSLGYILSYQTCCRSNSILNVQFFDIPGGQGPGEGATYSCAIPGTKILDTAHNSSAVFNIKDTVLICKSKNIDLDFSATDPDGDSLTYSFCSAYNRGIATDSRNVTPSAPPYTDVTYKSGYSGFQPMGSDIVIDPATGHITGMAPTVGAYVINVCVAEWRNGNIISVHRKDFMVRVGDCDFAAAELKPSYLTCDGFTLNFENESTSSGIHSYYWEFGDTSSTNISTDPTPTHTYADSGTYNVKLVINRGEECTDSTVTKALVYPGFFPDFKVTGSCVLNPYQFTDLTTSKYGIVNSWHWDFGDPSVTSDTSTIQNPAYKYPSKDSVLIQLIVTNSKGCIDTVAKAINISDRPTITLPFHDTLICNIDTLQLHSTAGTASAIYSWSPSYNISNVNTSNPFVSPKTTTTYAVTVNDKGCTNTDSVRVTVISKVELFAGNDTAICQTDTIQLLPVTNALYFTWTPSTSLSDAKAKNPFTAPLSNTQYKVVGSVGKCNASDVINIVVSPYPLVNAGTDASICFGQTTTLNASTNAPNFAWSPISSLMNANTLTPIAGPGATTSYILTAVNNAGCLKPVYDTITVNVIPPVPAFAGHDTLVVANQPLQLNATGGTLYSWTPATGMDNPNIANPVVTLDAHYDSVTYKVKVSTPEGCYAYDDIKVIVFKTQPDIFVPTGFTPNHDALNDILKPTLVGIKQFNYLKIFDRWGVMVFSTTQQGQGWDGTYAGIQQSSGTYVFMAQGIDYTGKLITKKGTVVLIR
jgi:gliding motility-associated-like protein